MRKLREAHKFNVLLGFGRFRILLLMLALLVTGNMMTAAVLTADRNTVSKAGEMQVYPCAVDIFYKGAMICVNSAGFAAPAADTAGHSAVVGVAAENIDNSGGSAGDLNVKVQAGRRFSFVATAIVQADVGSRMYVVDDQTFDRDPQVNAIQAGVLTEFTGSTSGWLHIGHPASVGEVFTTELTLNGRNETGSTFEAGDILYVNGYDETEDRFTLALADADAIGAAAMNLWTTRESLATATNGTMHKTFRETAQDTSSGTEGDRVYLSTTPGDWTRTTPQDLDPNGVTVVVGYIAVVNASTGVVEINLMAGGLEQVGTNELQDSAIATAKIAAAAVTRVKMEEGSIVFIDKQLTNTEVLALATGSGVELVAAPGSNKSLVFHGILLVADASNTAWTEPSAPDDLVVQYADGVDLSGTIEGTALIANSVNVRTYGALATEIVPDVNAAIMLFNTGGNWGGGNAANTMSVRIWYSVIDTIAFT